MNKLEKLVKGFYSNVIQDYFNDELKQGIQYFYYMESSLTTIMLLDRKAKWTETSFTHGPVEISCSVEISLSQPIGYPDGNYIISQRGLPWARIIINPYLKFYGHYWKETSAEQDFILLYEKDVQFDKFMIRRIQKTI